MRRIYESEALRRDDDDPFVPSDDEPRPRALRSIDAAAWSRWLLPGWLHRRAISIDVSTLRTSYPTGSSVPFTVTVENSLPVPVAITTTSPLLWTWSVDGVPAASHVADDVSTAARAADDGPAAAHTADDGVSGESRTFGFGRAERKQFHRRWSGRFQVSPTEWEVADPGEHTITVALDLASPSDRHVAETTVHVEPE